MIIQAGNVSHETGHRAIAVLGPQLEFAVEKHRRGGFVTASPLDWPSRTG